MKSSRIKRVLLCVAVAGAIAAAQADLRAETVTPVAPPVRLAPPPKAAAQPGTPSGAKPAAPAATTFKPPPPLMSEPTVQVSPLQAIDPDSAGVLDQSKGGFGVDMWAGASRDLVQRLVPQLPAAAPSPLMHDLMRRLLLSVATAPAGERAEPGLVALRIERLAAMGDADGVKDLLTAAPKGTDEASSRTRVESGFLADDTKSACDDVGKNIARYPTAYWQKAFAFCQAVGGEKEKARLAISLLREAEADKDPAFFTLAGVLLGDSKKKADIANAPTALEIAMLRAAKQPLPAAAADSDNAAVLKAVAAYADADPVIRVKAAERAEAAGMLSANQLAKIYSDVSFKPEEIDNALSEAEKDGGPRGRALLYQAAVKQGVSSARAEVLQAAWKMARKAGIYETSARVNAPLLFELTPSSELTWFAAEAGRALFVANEPGHAFAWYDFVAGAHDTDAQKIQAQLWPVAALADTEKHVTVNDDAVKQWLAAEKDLNADGWQERAALLLGLMNALGEATDPAARDSLIDAAHAQTDMPGLALWISLGQATDDNHIGETVLLSMLALGPAGPGGASAIVDQGVVASLAAVGLGDEARRLAVEAAVGHGL